MAEHEANASSGSLAHRISFRSRSRSPLSSPDPQLGNAREVVEEERTLLQNVEGGGCTQDDEGNEVDHHMEEQLGGDDDGGGGGGDKEPEAHGTANWREDRVSGGLFQHRVRFSSEIDRRSVPRPPSQIEIMNAPSQLGSAAGRAAAMGLTIDTSACTLATDTSRLSPSPMGVSPRDRSTSPRPALPANPSSPTPSVRSKSGRVRGYSLRRSLLHKSLRDKSPLHDGFIELENGSFSGDADGFQSHSFTYPTTTTSAQKQTVLASVSVEPKDDDNDPEVLKDGPKSKLTGSEGGFGSQRLRILDLILARMDLMSRRLRCRVFQRSIIPSSKDGRRIPLEPWRQTPLIDERTGKHYIKNTIRSSRYSLWSFFPRQLIAQFSKLANFYFLMVSVLQMIPNLSTTGTYTTIVPLIIFVGISMAKEGFDDIRRYRLDKEENNREAQVLRPGAAAEGDRTLSEETHSSMPNDDANEPRHWEKIKWVDIEVGDVVRLKRNEAAPADLALLHADGPNGIAYIETMALDGETNLKSKQPCQAIAKVCATTDDIINQNNNSSICFAVEDPNIDLYKFDGYVTMEESEIEKLPLTNTEVIYRGSVLRNTAEAIGMVIYTGEECKIRMNANKNPRIKAPALQSVVNRVVAVIVLFVVTLACVCTIAYKFWSVHVERHSWYLRLANVRYGPIFTSFLIMFNTMIPISLYVSLEIVKVCQMVLMNDIDMYDEESDTPLEARTSTINEELGQVSYIFSDKTGTLTDNSMRFRKMSVAGTAWLHDTDLLEEETREANRSMLIHKKRSTKGKMAASRYSTTGESARMSNGAYYMDQEENVVSPITNKRTSRYHRLGRTADMLQYVEQQPDTHFARKMRFFVFAMALCHTCLPERDEEGNISFQAASPDETALVTAAKELGYVVVDRQPSSITVRTAFAGSDGNQTEETYLILDVLEFSSARKRMSIVVRLPDGRLCIFCKGADSNVLKLLKRATLAAEKVVEIERRTSKRKTKEAMEVMRRNSEHAIRRGGKDAIRTSMSIQRSPTSIVPGGRRSSVSGKRRSSVRASIEYWLRERETDVAYDMGREEEENEYYAPRPSAAFGRDRISMALSDGRSSFQTEDSAVEELVEESLVVNESLCFERCFQHLNDFASEGLRTLLYGYRFIEQTEYEAWKVAYNEAATSLVDRQQKVEMVGAQLERDLELLGATAIEDKLQKGVPEAIDKLRRANIKLWMLTGDKRETAINVGHACRLVKDYSSVTILDSAVGKVETPILGATSDIKAGRVAHSVIVVDGQTLSLIEKNDSLTERFLNLAILADSVICCRASPKQKAFLVRSIRKQVTNSITLAIGDGANDIAMIQEAHVGIGITGKEGLQAARISDYSIAQFRFLVKLLLVHGRWNYIRVCKYTLGTFWKETLFYLTQALYQRWNGYTGTSLYEPWGLSMFNTLFTSLPVIFIGIFEKDLAASTLIAVPELYAKGQCNGGFNVRLYLTWAFMATCEAMVVFFTMFGLFGEAMFTSDNGIFAMGFLTFSACVIIISVKLQVLEIHNHSIMAIIAVVLSIGGWWLWNILLSEGYKINAIYNVRDNFLHRTGHNLLWWTTLFLSVAAVALFEITVNTVRVTLFPTDVDLFQEYERDLEIRKRFEAASAMELQQGWDRVEKLSSAELVREGHERQVRELLDRRHRGETSSLPRDAVAKSGSDPGPRVLVEEVITNARTAAHDSNSPTSEEIAAHLPRASLDIDEAFRKGYGTIRDSEEFRC